MTFRQAVKSGLIDKFASVKGRASRAEYWYFILFNLLAFSVVGLFFGTWSTTSLVGLLIGEPYRFYLLATVGTLINLVLFIAHVTMTIRRCHDFNMSGWLYYSMMFGTSFALLMLTKSDLLGTAVASIFAIFVGLRGGDPFDNNYGDAPDASGENRDQSTAPLPPDVRRPDRTPVVPRRLVAQLCAGLCVLVGLDLTLSYWVSRPAPVPYAEMVGQKAVLYYPDDGAFGTQSQSGIWAFNFSADVHVEPVLLVGRTVVGIDFDNPIGGARDGMRLLRTETRASIKSLEERASPVKLLFTLPDLGNAVGNFDDQRDKALHVILLPEPRTYPDSKDWGVRSSFTQEFDKLARFECMADREISPGISQLREPTKVEAGQILQSFRSRGPRFEFREGCLGKGADSGAAYTVADEEGKPSGFGRCLKYGARAEYGSCTFTFWLPQKRFVEYRFSEEFLPQLRAMDTFVRNQLDVATVKGVTKDLNYR